MRFAAKVFLFIVSFFVLAAVLMVPSAAQAGLASGYVMQGYPVSVEGQFTACDDQIHYWSANSGYNIYDIASGTTNTIGLPTNGTNSNGSGDPFGVLDAANNLFHAATYYAAGSDVYTYDLNTSTWQTSGPNGVVMANAYGGQVHNGQLYVSGLAEPWNGGYGQDTYIFAFDHAATPDGNPPRHDTLIQTAGNSAHLAVAPNGDVYYGTYSDNTLYRWAAAQVDSVTDALYVPGAVDNFLTLADAAESWAMPGGGNGLAVDEGGNVFFAVNQFNTDWTMTSVLAMLDSSQPSGYKEIYTETVDDYSFWFGAISVDGDFLNGDPLYFSTTWGGGIASIQQVPEPGCFVLIASAMALVLISRRRS